jgi:hypothetical protein
MSAYAMGNSEQHGPSVELTGRRAWAAGRTRVQFREATVEEFAAVQQFDAVVAWPSRGV